jgi:hypothetical protein
MRFRLLCACAACFSGGFTAWGAHAETALSVPAAGRVGFTAIDAVASGIGFTNRLAPEAVVRNQNFMNGSGVALGDVDGDGQVDLLAGANAFISSSGNLESGALYLLYGPVTYTGVVEMRDVADARWYGGADYLEIGFSIATGDTNNDQHDDILVCANPPDGTHRTGGAFFYYGEGI